VLNGLYFRVLLTIFLVIYWVPPIDIVKTAYDFCFAAVIRIILHSEDHGELQVIKISVSSLLHLYIDKGHLSLAF